MRRGVTIQQIDSRACAGSKGRWRSEPSGVKIAAFHLGRYRDSRYWAALVRERIRADANSLAKVSRAILKKWAERLRSFGDSVGVQSISNSDKARRIWGPNKVERSVRTRLG